LSVQGGNDISVHRNRTTRVAIVLVGGPCKDPPFGSGITGLAVRGPITPVCRVDVPCDAPAAEIVITVLDENGGEVAQVMTDDQGRFQADLPAGIYKLSAPGGIGKTVSSPITVQDGKFTDASLFIDTGIR
jgi:hypothetical protein